MSFVRQFDKLVPEVIKDNEQRKYTFNLNFLKRNIFTIRTPNDRGIMFSDDSFKEIILWLRSLRELFSINNIDCDLVIIMDETPAIFNPEIYIFLINLNSIQCNYICYL